jgi:A/G-specific adenine glycosylase
MSRHQLSELVERVIDWYDRNAREFPWRETNCSPWGILVSEIMSQQTQMSRVLPKWLEFLERWPTPADFADASDADAIRAWDRLGYPRRAIQLRRCAQAIVDEWGGDVPRHREDLLALPGIGPYTSAAVAAFAFGEVVPVVDTNVRRVLARTQHGDEFAWAPNHRRDDAEMLALLPEDEAAAASWTARRPACDDCPVSDLCEWNLAGRPPGEAPRRPQPKFEGSDRQVRGRIMALLRDAEEGVALDEIVAGIGAIDAEPRARALRLVDDLVSDGLAMADGELRRLPH